MPKLPKTQVRRLYRDIRSKPVKLWIQDNLTTFGYVSLMSTKDMQIIEAIISKYQKKLG